MVQIYVGWIVFACFVLLLLGTIAGIALAALITTPAPRVAPLSVRLVDSVQSPLAMVPFDEISERFLPEFRTYLTDRIAVSSSTLVPYEPKHHENAEGITAEQVAKSCELAKAITEAADDKAQEALKTLLEVVQTALSSEGQSAASAVIVAAGEAVAASALAIVAACASLLVALREGQEKKEFTEKLNYLLEISKMQEFADFRTAYSIARQQLLQQIESGRLDVSEFSYSRFIILRTKAMWFGRFQYDVQHAPSPLTMFGNPKPNKVAAFEASIKSAAAHLYRASFATYVDFCICDATGGTSMFVQAMKDDIAQLKASGEALDQTLDSYRSKVRMPGAERIRASITERVAVFTQLAAAIPAIDAAKHVRKETVDDITFKHRFGSIVRALLPGQRYQGRSRRNWYGGSVITSSDCSGSLHDGDV